MTSTIRGLSGHRAFQLYKVTQTRTVTPATASSRTPLITVIFTSTHTTTLITSAGSTTKTLDSVRRWKTHRRTPATTLRAATTTWCVRTARRWTATPCRTSSTPARTSWASASCASLCGSSACWPSWETYWYSWCFSPATTSSLSHASSCATWPLPTCAWGSTCCSSPPWTCTHARNTTTMPSIGRQDPAVAWRASSPSSPASCPSTRSPPSR